MATARQSKAARTNVRKAQKAASAKQRGIPGRSKMGRDDLARRLGQS